MATVIMPKMGDGMEEGTLLRWLKNAGDEVEVGDPIAEIETDKVTIEIEASETGVLTKTLIGEGQTVPIGTAIATIGDDAGAGAAPPAQPAAAQAAQAPAEPVASPPVASPPAAPAPPSMAANGAASARPEPTPAVRGEGDRWRASPLVKRLAAEHGLNLGAIAGSGPGGRIVKDDVMPYITGGKQAPAAPPASQPAAAAPLPTAAPQTQPAQISGRPAGVARELSKIRRTTGRRMAESKGAIPHFYVTSEVNMEPAIAFREQVNTQIQDDAGKVSFNDLIVKAVALALRQYPNLNATLEGETLFDHTNIDINIAVAIEGGLIAPFVPDADQKSLGAIARMAKDLINRARTGGLLPHEFQGGTFTISNLGMYDVEEFVAIINPPQAAILAIGSITETPVVRDGGVGIGHQMKIALSCDHRVTDGAEAAKFLIAVKGFLQNPMLMAVS